MNAQNCADLMPSATHHTRRKLGPYVQRGRVFQLSGEKLPPVNSTDTALVLVLHSMSHCDDMLSLRLWTKRKVKSFRQASIGPWAHLKLLRHCSFKCGFFQTDLGQSGTSIE